MVQRDQKRQERARLTQQAQTVRAEWRTHQEAVHQRDLEATNLRHQRDTLVQRLQEDYQLDLAEMYAKRFTAENAETAATNPGEVNAELEALLRKLSRLRTVHMDSLLA